MQKRNLIAVYKSLVANREVISALEKQYIREFRKEDTMNNGHGQFTSADAKAYIASRDEPLVIKAAGPAKATLILIRCLKVPVIGPM